MPRGGYSAVRWMRNRSKAQRGGKAVPGDGLDRSHATLNVHVDDYLQDMRVHNCTPDAVESRHSELRPFLSWADERGLLHPEQFTCTILESYQRWLWRYRKKNDKPLGISTQRGRLTGVKNLFAWLCKRHILQANPASELELPRPEKRIQIQALTLAEIEAVLSVPDITDPLGIRDRAMLEVFYSCGIRRSELAGLEVSELNRDKCLLTVHGKGRKDRVVPVGTRAMQWCEKYCEDVRPLLVIRPDIQTLFLSGYGEGFNVDVLSRKVADYIKRADIGRSGSCHLFRHTCASHMLEGGADIRYIQQLLGHEKLETTAVYTEVSILQLQAVHSRCHPAEKHDLSRRSPTGEGGCHPAK